jgi:CRISPR-associated protein Csm5
MYKYASSEVYSVTLTTKTPVFIGSGSTIGKKEFFVDRNKIHVLDMDAVMKAVFQNGLINDFQNLMLSNNYSSTHEFLKSFFTDTEIKEMIRYSCQCADVFSYGKPPTEIQQFWHTPDNHPYIPGSSVKGAIRTCLIGAELLDEQPVKYSEIKDRIHKLENKYNNIMRYLSVSDSEPLAPTDLTLCKKYDVNTLGTAKPLNLVRECIAPGKKLKFKITIDCSDNVLTLKTLQYAIKRFSEFYTDMTKNCS